MTPELLSKSIITILAKSAKDSEGGKNARNELSQAVWEWVRPLFLKDEEENLLETLRDNPKDEANNRLVKKLILDYVRNDADKREAIETILNKANPDNNGGQNVYNYGRVDKQINNPNIEGDLNM